MPPPEAPWICILPSYYHFYEYRLKHHTHLFAGIFLVGGYMEGKALVGEVFFNVTFSFSSHSTFDKVYKAK